MKSSHNNPPRFKILFSLCALLTAATAARAQTDTWTGGAGDNNWATPGNWNLTLAPTTGETPAFGAPGTGGLTLTNNLAAGTSFLGLQFNFGAPSFTLSGNSIASTGGILDDSTNLETINLGMVFAGASHSLYATKGGTLVVNGVISDGGSGYGITVAGGGLVSLTTNNNYIGPTTVNAGTLELDFNSLSLSSGGTVSNNIINPASALSLGGGTLDINGSALALTNGVETTNLQTFASTSLTAGSSLITFSGGTNADVVLGALTDTLGATVVFNGVTAMAGGVVGGPLAPQTGIVTTSTAGGGGVGLLGGNGTTTGDYATVGLYDWASTSGPGGTIVGGSEVSGFYTTFGTGNGSLAGNVDFTAASAGSHNTDSMNSVRFNVAGGCVWSMTSVCTTGGVLVTPNVGPANVFIQGTSGDFEPSRGGASATVFWQNNTQGFLVGNTANFFNNAKSGNGTLILAGLGTMLFNYTSTYSGATYINGPAVALISGNDLGAPATAATAYLNGGAIVANATFALDNAGANPRPIALGVNGGGLGAASNTFFTVDGYISGAAGTGPLFIGIPATTNNGNVLGLIPGTGPGTANAATNASGTVLLTGTSNSYTGGTILYSGTLNFRTNSLGTGGITFNGGTLLWATGTTVDISTQLVTVAAGGGVINLNGQSVTLANSIGGLGTRALTITNGTLTLGGSNTYTGGTTVGAGATLIANNTSGSATGTGPVIVQSGATLEGPGAISGAVTILPGGVFDPTVSGVGTADVGSLTLDASSTYNFQFNSTPANSMIVVTSPGGLAINGGFFSLAGLAGPGNYNLIQYSGSVGGSGLDSTWTTPSDANPHVLNPNQAYLYSFSLSGGYLVLTVSPNLAAVIAAWTNNVNSTWSTAANWSPNRVPHSPGDAAVLGVSTGLRTITLDVNESLGAITFSNANSFVIAGGSTSLTIDNSGATATLAATAGSANAIQTGVSLNSPTQVSVGSGDYLAISGSISNENNGTPETLLVNGAGTLALSGNSSYGPGAGSFGTTLTGGGTLRAGSANALGAGDLAVTGAGTLQAGASVTLANNIDIAPGVNVTVDSQGNSFGLSGTLSDSGNLIKIGSGNLTLGGNSGLYAGEITINAGALSISSDQNLGSDNNPVILNGGDLAGVGNVQIYHNLDIGASVGSIGTNAFIDATGGATDFSIQGTISSSGNLGINNLTINGKGGAGTVELQGIGTFNGTTVVAGGTLDVANPQALQDSFLNYNNQGGVLVFDSSIEAATFGGLSGSQSLALTNAGGGAIALTVGGNNSSGVYAGNLNDYGLGATFTKLGTGTLTLTGSNTYTGATTVSQGTLEIPAGGVLNVGVLAGSGYLVDGGMVTNAPTTVSSLANFNDAILQTAGSMTLGEITWPSADGIQLAVMGGTLSAQSLIMTRSVNYGTTVPTATAPIAAMTTTGLWIDSTNTLSPAQVYLGQLTIGSATANSSTSVRMDAGSLTVTNEILLGNIQNTRVDILQINGGNFTNLDTTNGITMSVNAYYAGASIYEANNSELYLSGGNSYVGILNFGAMSDSVGGEPVVFVDGGNLWMGSGGIDLSNQAGMVPVIYLESGILGATANWSSAVNGDGYTYGFLLPIAGQSCTIQAADPGGLPHNISLSGSLGGPGNLVKTGAGVLALSGANILSGTTTVSAGTLALGGDGTNTGVLSQTPTINVVAPGLLSVAGLTNDTLQVGDPSVNEPFQSLTGNGAVMGNVTIGTQGNLAPGTSATNFANFQIASNLTNAGALIFKVDHTGAGATNDSVSALSITNLPGSMLTVVQGTNDLDTGDTFKLLNIAGNAGVSSATNLLLTLPATGPVSGVTYVWNTNNLAVNGTIQLTTGASAIPTTPTNLTYSVSSGVLHLTWPSSYLGWSLQSNSISLAVTNDWITIAGSSAVTNENITLPTTGSVFFRMYNP